MEPHLVFAMLKMLASGNRSSLLHQSISCSKKGLITLGTGLQVQDRWKT
jgi:hypothetical protein